MKRIIDYISSNDYIDDVEVSEGISVISALTMKKMAYNYKYYIKCTADNATYGMLTRGLFADGHMVYKFVNGARRVLYGRFNWL